MNRTSILLFLAAFAVRLIGIGWGLPNREHYFSYHPDEWLIAGVSYSLFVERWVPGFYNYGSLPLYLFGLWFHILTGWGAIKEPDWRTAGDLEIALFRHDLHLWARVLVAFIGALTVLVVYRIGQKVGGNRTALIAGLVMVIAPGHVIHSRFQTVDVPTTLFAALTFLSAVRLYDSPKPLREVIWGSVWAGCAAGSKYNVGLVLIALLVSLYYQTRQQGAGSRQQIRQSAIGSRQSGKIRDPKSEIRISHHLPTSPPLRFIPSSALSILIALLTFLIVCPGVWADPATFWQHFFYEVRHVQQGHGMIFKDTGLGWIYHLTPNLTYGFGIIPLVLAVIGWVLGWKRYPAMRGILLATLAYYLLIGAAEVRFLRYTLPLYPALALGIGVMVSGRVGAWEKGRVEGWKDGRMEGEDRSKVQNPKSKVEKPKTQNQKPKTVNEKREATNAQHPTPNTQPRVFYAVLILGLLWQAVWTGSLTTCMVSPDPRDRCVRWFRQNVPPGARIAFATVPWFYTPPFFPSTGELAWQARLEKMGAESGATGYALLSLAPPDWNVERLGQENPDWIVLSEFEYGDAERLSLPEYRRFMEVIKKNYPVEKRFIRQPFPFPKTGLPPHDLLYIYPEVRVYGKAGDGVVR